MDKTNEARLRPGPKPLPTGILAALTTTSIIAAGLLSSYANHRLVAHKTNALEAAALRWAPLLLLIVMGVAGGALTAVTRKSRARGQDLAAANAELRRINQKLQAEAEQLRASEARFQLLFFANPYPMWIFDCETLAITEVNEAALRQYGYTREEFLAISALDLCPPEERDRFFTTLRTTDRGYGFCGIWRHRRKDGIFLSAEICVFRFERDGGTRELVLAHDVTPKLQAEEALRRSEAALKSMVENAPFGICRGSLRDDRIEDCNPAFVELLGYTRDELLSMCVSSQLCADPSDLDRALEILSRCRKLNAFEATLLRKDGTPVRVRLWGVLKARAGEDYNQLDVYVEDVTGQSTLEQQVRQVQKLEAVGRLAGGIAHDFNNILVVIRLSTELMLGQVTLESPLSKPLLQVLNAADRAGALTRQLLAFGRQQLMQSRTVSVNTVVSDTLKLLRRTIGEDIRLTTKLCDDLENTRIDPDQLAQVIMNLAINSRDAMPSGGGLDIETRNVELDESYVQTHGPVRPGKYVMLAVSDTGTGMDKSILPHIFDPFFTTKEVGKGTGLGLSIVYGIVKQSGGYVWVYSEPGQGTTFKLYFPVTGTLAEPAEQQPQELIRRVGESTILVVEDEAEIRQNLHECLQQLGYKILEAADGLEALRILQEQKDTIDLVLTDLVMPRMGGHELATNVARQGLQVGILFMSGYTENNAARRDILSEGAAFLTKPFSVAELSSAVHRALSLRAIGKCAQTAKA